MLKEAYRVMKGGGIILVGVPGIKGFEADDDHKIYYNPEALKQKMESYGFKLKKIHHMPLKSKRLEVSFKRYVYYGVFTKV